jgi:hypothetical protein
MLLTLSLDFDNLPLPAGTPVLVEGATTPSRLISTFVVSISQIQKI